MIMRLITRFVIDSARNWVLLGKPEQARAIVNSSAIWLNWLGIPMDKNFLLSQIGLEEK
jgi:hypothetical protein